MTKFHGVGCRAIYRGQELLNLLIFIWLEKQKLLLPVTPSFAKLQTCWFAIWLHQITSQFAGKMSAAASHILAFTFIFLPSVSSLNKGEKKTTHEIAYGSVVDYSIVKISYPFMVRIIMDGSYRCGGALISDRWVNRATQMVHCQATLVII
jgi:hypothetical protein